MSRLASTVVAREGLRGAWLVWGLVALCSCGRSARNPNSEGDANGTTGVQASTATSSAGAGAAAETSGSALASGGDGADDDTGSATGTGGVGSRTSASTTGGAGEPSVAACANADDCTAQNPVDLCVGTWDCVDGECVMDTSSAVDCSSTQPEECHDVVCVPATGACEQLPAADARPCGDGYCTEGTCGVRTGTCNPSVVCDGCTSCDAEAQACLVPAGSCNIAGACVPDGTLSEEDGCWFCDAASPDQWSPLPMNTTCWVDDPCFLSFVCDGAGACVGDTAKRPGTPKPKRPISGTRSGSPWAPGDRNTLKPRFVWSEVSNVDACAPITYDLQADHSCADIGSCEFDNPALDVTGLSSTSFRPETDLAVDLTPPVGRRYYWRVRACRANSCSDWSSRRYVDVGRAPHDYNGDGYTDLAIGSAAAITGIYYGSPDGVSPDEVRVATDRDATTGSTGDINGDGFSDMILFSWHDDSNPKGRLNAYMGSATGLSDLPVSEILRRATGNEPVFAEADFEGDGYADLIVHPGLHDSMGDYFKGSATGLPESRTSYFASPEPSTTHQMTRMRSGDINGDAISDFIANSGPIESTYVYVSSGGLPSVATDVVSGLTYSTGHRPHTVLVDTNGDYGDDLVIGMTRSKDHDRGVLYQFLWDGGFPATPSLTLPDTTHPASDNYGTDVVTGLLVGGDEDWELVVSAGASEEGGTLYVYEAFNLTSAVPIELHNPGDPNYTYAFGNPLQVPGDINGDGYDDLIACDTDNDRALVYYGPIEGNDTLPGDIIVETYEDFPQFCNLIQ